MAVLLLLAAGLPFGPAAADPSSSGCWDWWELVEHENAGYATTPSVGVDGNDTVVVAWIQNDGARLNAWANRYVPGLGWQGPTRLENNDNGNVISIDLAVSSQGHAVAVWGFENRVVPNYWSIYAAYYAPGSGWGTASLLETDETGDARYPKVAIDAAGNAVAAWHQWDGVRYNLWVNRHVSGTGWSGSSLLESDNNYSALNPDVAMDAGGNATVVWQQATTAPREDLFANRYVPGVGWSGASFIEMNDVDDAQWPRIASNPGGTLVATWIQTDNGQDSLWSNRYTPGSGWSSPSLVETLQVGRLRGDQTLEIDVAVDSYGNAMAVWSLEPDFGTVYDVYANRYPVGGSWGTQIRLEASGDSARDPALGVDPSGNAMVVWILNVAAPQGGSRSARFDVATGWGSVFQVPSSSNYVSSPAIALDSQGRATVITEANAFPADLIASRWDPSDIDGDGLCGVADNDDDGDGVQDDLDSFPSDPTEWSDQDGDGVGDNSDPDMDGDGVPNAFDALPDDPGEWNDTDGDRVGNNADPDDDNDGVPDTEDRFPGDANESLDTDGDGLGDAADTDDDNDGVADASDTFPTNPGESRDTDGDGVGDNADWDDDGDGWSDVVEAEAGSNPLSSTSLPPDLDGDTIPDYRDLDLDGDGTANPDDGFPYDPSEQRDLDGDGVGDNADPDEDGDGIPDALDACPRLVTDYLDTDMDGACDGLDADDDADTVPDVNDDFPLDPQEQRDLDRDGVGDLADPDDDNDGVPDATDDFPWAAAEGADTDDDGLGDNADSDDDNDGWADAVEISAGSNPSNPATEPSDFDSDGVPDVFDIDLDGDGVGNSEDGYPLDPTRSIGPGRSEGEPSVVVDLSGLLPPLYLMAVMMGLIFVVLLLRQYRRSLRGGKRPPPKSRLDESGRAATTRKRGESVGKDREGGQSREGHLAEGSPPPL